MPYVITLILLGLLTGNQLGQLAKNFDIKTCEQFGRGVICQPKK